MERDHRVVMVVVSSLAGIVGVALVGIIVLAFMDRTIPEVLAGIATTSLGALGAVLVSTRTGPAPVIVENRPDDAVPVETAKAKR